MAKINRSFHGTGGGPALTTCLTDVEQRVLAIVGIQAATGLDHVEEVGFPEVTYNFVLGLFIIRRIRFNCS